MRREHRAYMRTQRRTPIRTYGRTHTCSYQSGTWVQSQSQSQSQSQNPILSVTAGSWTQKCPASTTDRRVSTPMKHGSIDQETRQRQAAPERLKVLDGTTQ